MSFTLKNRNTFNLWVYESEYALSEKLNYSIRRHFYVPNREFNRLAIASNTDVSEWGAQKQFIWYIIRISQDNSEEAYYQP